MFSLRTIKAVGFCSILILIIPFLIHSTSADGLIINPWGMPFDEAAQTAIVVWDKGMETLALHVSSNAPHGSFWLVPIPSKPEVIAVSHARTMTFSGSDRGTDAWSAMRRRIVGTYVGMVLVSQVYPMVSPMSWAVIYKLWMKSPPVYMPLVGEMLSGLKGGEGVSIHEVVQSYGLTTYVITAENADSFYQFLSKIGARIPEEVKGILGDYIGKAFSFVVSRIEREIIFSEGMDYNVTGEQRIPEGKMPIRTMGLGVVITFPTDKPFYPLVSTSVYGSKIIPIRIYVNGLWQTQDISQPLSSFMKVQYFVDAHLGIYADPVIRAISGLEMREYTLIAIDAPSKYLRSDLDFHPASLVGLAVDFSWLMGVGTFLACSIVASVIATLLLGRRSARDVAKGALLGIANLLTIIGYYWISSQVLGKEKHYTSNSKALVASAAIAFALLVFGISIIGLWLVIPHYYIWALIFTPIISVLCLLPGVAVSWVYWRLNASSIALGAGRTAMPINGKAAKQTLVFSVVLIILFAIVTHALILSG